MNRQAIIDRLLAQYQIERQAAHAAAEETRRIIAEKAPVYADFESALAKAVREGMKRAKESPGAGRDAIISFKRKAEKQLKTAGYSLSDLEPKYKCPDCKDTAYVGEPIKEFCHCFKRRLCLMLMRDEDIDISLESSFESFDLSVFPETSANGFAQRAFMEKVKPMLERYCKGVGSGESRFVMLYGRSGLGKTYLLDCMLRAVVENGRSVMKATAYRLGEMIRRKHLSVDSEEESAFDRCLDADILAIDDLGSEPMLENVTITYLNALISERLSSGKPVIITTNLNLTGLEQRYTERIFSRIVAKPNIIIRLDGDDVRHGVKSRA